MKTNRPILVTGSPRSGTTWVGRLVGQAPFVRYVHEPFNISSRPCHCGVKFDYWFQYLSPESISVFLSHLKHTIFPAYDRFGLLNIMTEIAQARRIRPLSRYLQAYLSHRPVIKDPIAVFSAQPLAALFDMDVVVLIRHPAAIVSSYKSLNWTQSFSHFLNQPELMDDHLSCFRSEIEEFVKNDCDVVDQIALLWKLIHHVIIKYQETQPDWIFVRYEDLASDPIEGYRKMFDQLGLPFSAQARRAIHHHSQQHLPAEITNPYAIKQNWRLAISKWQKNLTAEEIRRIRARVEDVSSVFYTAADWDFMPPDQK